jgi:hypothetical protein
MRYMSYFGMVLLLVMCMSSCSGQQSVDKEGSPVATRTAVSATTGTGSLETCATSSAMNFYQDIKKHELKQAYTYVDPQGHTEDGQKLTYGTFTQQVQMGGTNGGPFSVDLGGYQASIAEVTMTITNQQFRYHSHLQFRAEGGTCKILSLDRV